MVKVKHPQAKTMKVDKKKSASPLKEKSIQKPNKTNVKNTVPKNTPPKNNKKPEITNKIVPQEAVVAKESKPAKKNVKVEKTKAEVPAKPVEAKTETTVEQKPDNAKQGKKKDNKNKTPAVKKERVPKEKVVLPKIKETTFIAPKILVSTELIEKAVKALKEGTAKLADSSKLLFGNEFRYGLQLRTVKIPECPKRNARMSLKHPLVTPDDSICFLVKDDIPGKKANPEKTVSELREIFRSNNLDFIKNIIPFGVLKKEYRTFELKRKLANSYDMFLVDARINDNVFGFCGKAFIARRKNPNAVDMSKIENIEKEVQKALRKVIYKIGNGPIINIDVATDKMTQQQFVENIEKVLDNLNTSFPGGYANIQSIHLIPQNQAGLVVPLYYSSANPNQVAKVVIPGPKKTKIMKMKTQLSTLSARYTLDTKGKIVKKSKKIQMTNKEQKKPVNIIGKTKDDAPKDEETVTAEEPEPSAPVQNKNKNMKKRKQSEKSAEPAEAKAAAPVVAEKKVKTEASGKKANKDKKLKSKSK